MVATIKEIKALLAKADPVELLRMSNSIATGELATPGGSRARYDLLLGWNIAIANICDETWGVFNIRLMRHIKAQNYSEPELSAVLGRIQLDDHHWRWLDKALVHHGDQYKWFFLMAEGYPQAACLVFHPKPSAIDGAGIFYIEYIAAAPWNRENPLAERSFQGVGKVMVSQVCAYARTNLGLRPGFSLHSLPRAAGFYGYIGMQRFPSYDKDVLQYFEMPPNGKLLREVSA